MKSLSSLKKALLVGLSSLALALGLFAAPAATLAKENGGHSGDRGGRSEHRGDRGDRREHRGDRGDRHREDRGDRHEGDREGRWWGPDSDGDWDGD